MTRYFHISAGLRGAYCDGAENAFVARLGSYSELRDVIAGEASSWRDAGYIGGSKRAVASVAMSAWHHPAKLPYCLPLARARGNYAYGVFIGEATRDEYLAYVAENDGDVHEESEWFYVGDKSLRHGGYYWREDGAADYVRAVRVIPASDWDGDDNTWRIESGSIYIGEDQAKIDSALACCGWMAGKEGASRSDVVDAMLAYHGVEADSTTYVRIGARQSEDEVDCVLPGRASLRRYVERSL